MTADWQPNLARVKSQAELVAGKRDGKSTRYERFDPEEWKGDRAKDAPTELFTRGESYESGPDPKTLAATTLRLIDHVCETVESLDSLVDALPVHDLAGRVLKTEIGVQIRRLIDGFGTPN